MVLKAEGDKVTGTFAWNSGRIEGTLAKGGHMLTGKWRKAPTYEPGPDGGLVLLVMDREGRVLRGQYWNGDRKSGRGQMLVAVRADAPEDPPAAPSAASQGAGAGPSQPGG
jgi:hypothetical protein